MYKLLQYPFNSQKILSMRKKIRRELLNSDASFIQKKIAILGGSTTHDIRDMMELFLLDNGISATFYESEYGQYWTDAMFGTPKLVEFNPDIIFIHTSNRNILKYPEPDNSIDYVNQLLDEEYGRFVSMWDKLSTDFNCPIIQNNFEYPFWRLMGNADVSLASGRVNYITRLNLKFAEYAQTHDGFYINDINWLSADYGLEAWSEPFYWYMYKYALAVPAIPKLSQSVANITKSIFGKNKKAFAIDLDNTLWGGIVGDDGAENIQIGSETSIGQAYFEFQEYIKAHKKLGILLNIISKNEEENALAGLNRAENALHAEDFVAIKANWEPKSDNLQNIINELDLLPESFVFIDDNPAEREIINQTLKNVQTPEITKPEKYITAIDRAGYFELTSFTKEDLARFEQYKNNIERNKLQTAFTDYDEYLRSLEMVAKIKPFEQMYISRIAQLTNKSNQFNLTTLRCTQKEIEEFATDSRYITLSGRLKDKFGDNGIVSVVMADIKESTELSLHIRLWLMSCRVLKRDFEYAMIDELVRAAKKQNIYKIYGYYYPTQKNAMVSDFYDKLGFVKLSDEEWVLDISQGYENKQNIIEVKGSE